MPLYVPTDDVTLPYLQELVDQKVQEDARLDYKRELPKRDDRGRNDFIADVSAFANSSGGDLVYGIEEDGEGRAMALQPLEGNRDEEVRRLQDYALNSIEPRIPGVQVHAIPAPNGFFILVRVPLGWTTPS